MRWTLSLLVATVWLNEAVILAQTNRGAIRGSILDPTGGAVPSAVVHADNVDTNVRSTLTSLSDGGLR